MNRLCGSGFQAIVTAAQEIQLGESDVVLCGGSENMSQAPYALRDARFGTKLGLDLKVRGFLLYLANDKRNGLVLAAFNASVQYILSASLL